MVTHLVCFLAFGSGHWCPLVSSGLWHCGAEGKGEGQRNVELAASDSKSHPGCD